MGNIQNHSNGQQRKLKNRVYHKDDLHHKYIPFDFQKYAKEQKQKQLTNMNVPSNTLNRKRSGSHQIFKNTQKQKPKSVKFNNLNPNQNGISFRKSHNNIPVMHPDEIEAIKNNKNNKKKKKNFYKQRASYSAAHYHSNKNQKQNKNVHKLQNGNALYAPLHKEDEKFLHSLIEPTKKKELNDAIDRLKQVMQSPNITNLIGSNIEMSLREVLRKLQLLRLDATLREYKQSNSKQSNAMNHSKSDYDDEFIASTHSSPEKFKSTENESNKLSKEQEQNRILQSLSSHNSEDGNGDNLVSALLFASKYHKQLYAAPRKSTLVKNNESDNIIKNALINGKTLKRRRFTLSTPTPTESDHAGIEVARWLSTGYSTFGRYKLPPSPLSKPIKNKQQQNKQKNVFSPLTLNERTKSIEDEKKEQKR